MAKERDPVERFLMETLGFKAVGMEGEQLTQGGVLGKLSDVLLSELRCLQFNLNANSTTYGLPQILSKEERERAEAMDADGRMALLDGCGYYGDDMKHFRKISPEFGYYLVLLFNGNAIGKEAFWTIFEGMKGGKDKLEFFRKKAKADEAVWTAVDFEKDPGTGGKDWKIEFKGRQMQACVEFRFTMRSDGSPIVLALGFNAGRAFADGLAGRIAGFNKMAHHIRQDAETRLDAAKQERILLGKVYGDFMNELIEAGKVNGHKPRYWFAQRIR